jgi:hypothetical protein
MTQMDPIPYLNVENYTDVNYTKVQIPNDPLQNERVNFYYWSNLIL